MESPLKLITFCAAIALSLGSICCAGSASAFTSVPAAVSGASCNSNNPTNTVNDPVTCTLQGAQVVITENPYVLIQTSASNPAGVATQDAFGSLSYSFTILGGTPGNTVPVQIETDLLTNADANSYAFANFNYGGGAVQVCIGAGASCSNSQFNGTVSYNATVGTAQNISFFVGSEITYSSGGYAYASADPLIFIAPSDNPGGQYSILLSAGIGNGLPPTQAPEPATWAIMLVGILGLSAATRCGARARAAIVITTR